MSGIIRWAEGGIRPLATLHENGWVCVHNQLPYRAVYQRGDEIIELEREGVAFYSLGDRRATNGTWEKIVERYAVKRTAVATKAHLNALIDRLDGLEAGHTLTDDDVTALNAAIALLLQQRDHREG